MSSNKLSFPEGSHYGDGSFDNSNDVYFEIAYTINNNIGSGFSFGLGYLSNTFVGNKINIPPKASKEIVSDVTIKETHLFIPALYIKKISFNDLDLNLGGGVSLGTILSQSNTEIISDNSRSPELPAEISKPGFEIGYILQINPSYQLTESFSLGLQFRFHAMQANGKIRRTNSSSAPQPTGFNQRSLFYGLYFRKSL